MSDDENLIEENLKPLATANKKKYAQDCYYAGTSPLTRSIASMHERKQPVHQRLGVKKLVRRQNGVMQVKQRLRLRRTNAPMLNGPIKTLRRTGSVQQRLYNIRRGPPSENLMSQMGPKRRPTNITVQVNNTNFRKPAQATWTHTVRGSLNQQIQSEIQMIQSQSSYNHELIGSEPLVVPGHGFTGVYTNDRFSILP